MKWSAYGEQRLFLRYSKDCCSLWFETFNKLPELASRHATFILKKVIWVVRQTWRSHLLHLGRSTRSVTYFISGKYEKSATQALKTSNWAKNLIVPCRYMKRARWDVRMRFNIPICALMRPIDGSVLQRRISHSRIASSSSSLLLMVCDKNHLHQLLLSVSLVAWWNR